MRFSGSNFIQMRVIWHSKLSDRSSEGLKDNFRYLPNPLCFWNLAITLHVKDYKNKGEEKQEQYEPDYEGNQLNCAGVDHPHD